VSMNGHLPMQMSVVVQSSRKMTERRSSPGSNRTFKFWGRRKFNSQRRLHFDRLFTFWNRPSTSSSVTDSTMHLVQVSRAYGAAYDIATEGYGDREQEK